MKNAEAFRPPMEGGLGLALSPHFEENARFYIRGDVFIKMHDARTGELQHEWEKRNLVVLDASILIARLMKDNKEPPFGCFCLAMGTGDTGWNPMAPPAPTNTQFINAGGLPVAIPTKVVDFQTTYTESEAVGPLVEMGILGGNISTNLSIKNPVSPPNGPYDPTVDLTTKETLVNYLSFPVINKPATSTLTVVWRLTF